MHGDSPDGYGQTVSNSEMPNVKWVLTPPKPRLCFSFCPVVRPPNDRFSDTRLPSVAGIGRDHSPVATLLWSYLMFSPAAQTSKSSVIDLRLQSAVDRLLAAGMKLGPTGKHNAINKVLELVPELTRGDCWQRMRQLRKTIVVSALGEKRSADEKRPQQVVSKPRLPSPHWTREDDEKLLNWAGYEPVDKIAQRLSRSVRAVRFRLCALGMSARVTDGWSLRALMKLLRISSDRLRQFIGNGMLRVRDPRITAASLTQFCDNNAVCLSPTALQRATAVTKREAYTWERAAELLGVDQKQVQAWISVGQLKVMDTFITDRSFEEFCRKHGSAINIDLIDPATTKWLIEEYGVPAPTSGAPAIPRAQKHALTVRTCKCGRKIAGNVYFKHVKCCNPVSSQAMSHGPNVPTQNYSSM